MAKDYLKDYKAELDKPIETGLLDIFKKGKIRGIIIYEDCSHKEFWVKFNRAYIVTVKDRDYAVIPECILKGKRSTIVWYFNNPMPINFVYTSSKLTAKDLVSPEKLKVMKEELKNSYAKIKLDSEALHAVFTTRLLQGLYEVPKKMSTKQFLIFFVIGVVVLLIMMQVLGYDVVGQIKGLMGSVT